MGILDMFENNCNDLYKWKWILLVDLFLYWCKVEFIVKILRFGFVGCWFIW